MTLTERMLNRTTLQRQMLLEREVVPVPDAIRRLVALQAQEPASPYLALWNRLLNFDPNDLDAAFASHRVVRSTMMRITLHAMHGDDHRLFREAMETTLRTSRLNKQIEALELQHGDDLTNLISDLLAFTSEVRSSPEIEAWIASRLERERDPQTWQLLRAYVPVIHAPGRSPWTYGGRTRWLTPREVPMLADPEVAPKALAQLIRRYLAGFGPATVPDVATFLTVQRWRIKDAVSTMDDLVELAGPGRATYYDLPGMPLADEEQQAPPRLMAMWDSVLLATQDRSRILPAEYRKTVIRTNGDVLPTLLVDGYVAGLWRTVEGGVEMMAFQPLPNEVWQTLEQEAKSLVAMLANRDPRVYRRYDFWWSRLPDCERRLLAAP